MSNGICNLATLWSAFTLGTLVFSMDSRLDRVDQRFHTRDPATVGARRHVTLTVHQVRPLCGVMA